MACVQGTWWGVGGGVVGGWWGSWLWCRVSGWGWVLGLGCLVGGGVRLVGPGFLLAGGVVGGGLFPLDPSLTPAPIRLVCCGSWFGPSRCWVVQSLVGGCLWVAVLFWGGGLGLWVVCLAGCVLVGLFSTWGRGCCSRWLLRFGRVFVGVFRGGGLCGLCLCRGVVLGLAVSFPLGGPTWTVGLFVAPLFLPPHYTIRAPTPPNPVGELTR